MNDTLSPARAYIETWAQGDRDALAALVDENVDFAGPLSRLHGRDAFLDAVVPFTRQLREVRVLHEAGEPHDTIILYAMLSDAYGEMPVCEHVRFTNGLLSWSRLIFDTAPLRAGAGE